MSKIENNRITLMIIGMKKKFKMKNDEKYFKN